MDEERPKIRKIVYSILLFSVLILSFVLNIYSQQRSLHTPATLKSLLSKKDKTVPKLWKQLLVERQNEASNTDENLDLSFANRARIRELPDLPMADQDIDNLIHYLNANMIRFENQGLPEIRKNVEVANEIISRVPDSYSAYKAKLILLLVQEAKYNQIVDDDEINYLLEAMALFDISSNLQAIKETILLSSLNNEILQLELNLANTYAERQEIELILTSMDINSLTPEEVRLLEARHMYLLAEEQNVFERIVTLERDVNEGESFVASILNEDIVHIPFLRMLAKEDYNAVISNAQYFIEQYPDSPIGYFYLVKTLRLLNREDEVLPLILNSQLSRESLVMIQDNLERSEQENPKDYWKNLKF